MNANIKEKKIYFIFAQKDDKNEPYKLEENENIKNIKILKEEKKFAYSYLLYSITISSIYQEKNVSLFLNQSGERHIASVECYKPYPDIFLYKVDFKPFNKNINKNLNQIIVPYKEQFIIFQNTIVKENNDLLNYLIQSSLDFIHNSSLINLKEDLAGKISFEFDYYLYLFINCLFLDKVYGGEKLLKIFFDEFNVDLINAKYSYNKYDSNKALIEDIGNPTIIDSLKDFNKINKDVISMTKNDETISNKLDLILAYYYFNYKRRIFIDFISKKNERKEKLLINLDKNRKLFLDFSSEIMDFDIFNEAENLEEIQFLFSLIPNLPELMKVFSLEELYIKFMYLSQIENKVCNLAKILKPNKNDNIELLHKNFEDLMKIAKLENFVGFVLSNDFFLDYCELFYNENLKNIELLIDIYKTYTSSIANHYENIEQELYIDYYETGIHLIKCGKLNNADVISFISQANKYLKKVELPNEVYNSIVIGNDITFINNFLNGKYNLGDTYIKFIKNFFNNFKTLKDFLNISKWEKKYCKNDEVLFICFDTLKNLMIKEKDNKLSKSLNTFIAELFIIISKKKNDFIDELINLDKNINNSKMFLNIFSVILTNNDYTPESLMNYIKNYIDLNTKEGEPLTIYYKVITLPTYNGISYLKDNLSIQYAIKVEDFINYPNVVEDRIMLFINLYQGRYFFVDDFEMQKHEYFKKSIEAKDKINTLKYKDAINMCKYMTDFQALFLFFLPHRINEDNDYLIDTLLIDFYENCNKCKEQYNSLKLVLNYWKHFFNFTKKFEINELINFLITLENTPIIDFSKYEINIDSFLFYLNEAQTKDKLFNSFFFMGLYQDNSVNFKENEECEKFDYALIRFKELKSLGINSNIDNLSSDLINKLIELVYKNNDRLDDELNFIKEYFEFDQNEDTNNFDINKIKRAFTIKVNNYKINKNLDDYEIEFEDFSLIGGNLNLNKNAPNITTTNIIKTTKDDDDEFNLFTNEGDDDFCLLDKDEDEKIPPEVIQPQEQIYINEDEKKELLKEIKQMFSDYFKIYKISILNDNNIFEENILLEEKLKTFFWETFKNIGKYNVLSEKDFYEDILISMTKIFLAANGTNFFKIENNNKEIYLIYEFYDILEIYKKYHLINKFYLNKLIERLLECKESENKENTNIIESIDHLFIQLQENENYQKKDLSTSFIKILVQEKIKQDNDDFSTKIINLFLRDDYKYLLNDSMPLLDQIFKEDIESKININERNDDNITEFNNFILKEIEKKCKDSKDFEELILYYFESKINIIFNRNKQNLDSTDNIYQNESMKSYLNQCLNFLESDKNEIYQDKKKISILFCLAFIKCYLYNYIKELYKYNQDIGDTSHINNYIIKGLGKSIFRTSIKLYVLKLFFYCIGNYYDFSQFNYSNYQIDYFNNEDIENIKDNNIIGKNNLYGFDYLLISLKNNEFEEYIKIEQNLYNLILNDNNNSDNLISMINNSKNLDIFLCAFINIFISNFRNKDYFYGKEYKNISNWISENMHNNKFTKFNNLIKKVLLLFVINKNYENKILKINENITYGNLSYNQLLTISFSLRYVFNTLLYSNENNLYYQILSNGAKAIKENKYYFNDYKNNDSNIDIYRNINYLTYTIIRFIILSHLYFSYLLDNISLSDINTLFLDTEEDFRMLDLLEQEFELIKEIIELRGIKNIIVFMNYVFNDIKTIIIDIGNNNDDTTVRNIESNIEIEIAKYVENFDNYLEKYNNFRNKMNIKEEKNVFKNIVFEDKEFYNNKNIDKKYPYISYLTITNFSSINDFKNQFYYLVNDKYNYPMINCLLNNLEIIKISAYLPDINSLFNEIYNELAFKIKKEDIEKTINDYINDNENIKNKLDIYNNHIEEINKMKSFSKDKFEEININSKISEVININGNTINKLFNIIIQIYNEFLINTKIYKDNKKYIEPLIIQNISKNDYYILDKDNNNKPIDDKLEEIVSLYSKRNRYNKEILNVYNGSKINYDFNQIEMILQKEFLYGKRPFQDIQRTFIFSNEVFSGDRNNLIDNLKNKYPQKDINEEILIKRIDEFVNDENKTRKIVEQIYYNLQYILIYLITYDNNNYDCENISLEYIAKIIQKSNYQINDSLMDLLRQNDIHINNLLFLYQKIEIKCFEYLTEEIKNQFNDNNVNEETNNKIIEYFKNDKLLLNEIIILDSIKKYILRYCIGNYQNKNDIPKYIDLEKILNKTDVWDDKIYNNDNFKEEKTQLININNENNCLMKYFLNKLFESKKEIIEEKNEEINENKAQRRRKKRKNNMFS